MTLTVAHITPIMSLIVHRHTASKRWIAPSGNNLIARACAAAGFAMRPAMVSRDPLANRGVMTLTRSEQFLCFFRTFRFDPPLFDTRDQHGRMKGPQLRLL